MTRFNRDTYPLEYGQKGAIITFGYIICNKSGLSEQELRRYQEMYCGVCKSLQQRHGQLSRFSLNFDMTFLALFLTALYEPQENSTRYRCLVHPLKKRNILSNPYIEYAADMTVALAYYKCLDDWEDERKHSRLAYGTLLKEQYHAIKGQYERQCQNIKDSLDALHRIEKGLEDEPDLAVNLSGKMLAEIFVYKEDFWSDSLRKFGFALGRFIYLMDAAMDYKHDIKKDNYNPLLSMKKKPEDIEDILTAAIGRAAQEFEKLPIVTDDHLIRNILYGGVWQKYYAKFKGKETIHG